MFVFHANARTLKVSLQSLMLNAIFVSMHYCKKKATIKIEHPSKSNLVFQMSMFCDLALSSLDDLCPHHACYCLCSACDAIAHFLHNTKTSSG